MSNALKFKQIMELHGIETHNEIPVSKSGYLDVANPHRLFTGHTTDGRAFVNIPVLTNVHQNDHVRPNLMTGLTVFQRYHNNPNIFVVGACPYPMQRCNFLLNQEEDVQDFSKLDILLSGVQMRFHEIQWLSNGRFYNNPEYYVDVVLNTTQSSTKKESPLLKVVGGQDQP